MWWRFWEGIRTASGAAWSLAKIWFWQMLAAVLLVMLFIGVVVRPLSAPPEATEEDIATAWNKSIARLGLLPIFPPAEDIYVGDLLAVVADSEETPLLGKAVRISHLDLRKEVREANHGLPVFSETVEPTGANKIRRQDDREIAGTPADERIPLTLVAFPGITITHAVRSAGSIDWSFWRLGAGRQSQEVEQIRIPIAESYGAPTTTALIQLDAWCADEQTKIFCTDQFVRRVMAFAVSDRVLATREGRYIARLQLRLVTRVYLTREIEHRRFIADANGALVQVSLEPGRPTNTASSGANSGAAAAENESPPAHDRATINALTQDTANAVSGRPPSAKASAFRADQREIAIHEVFQRPIAFGFRAVTVALTPATPSQKASP